MGDLQDDVFDAHALALNPGDLPTHEPLQINRVRRTVGTRGHARRNPVWGNLERGLKMAILHRKNSLAFMTLRGARVGDVFMSLIHTCELNRVNPFDYLMALQQHTTRVARTPTQWLPWNYCDALNSLDTG